MTAAICDKMTEQCIHKRVNLSIAHRDTMHISHVQRMTIGRSVIYRERKRNAQRMRLVCAEPTTGAPAHGLY